MTKRIDLSQKSPGGKDRHGKNVSRKLSHAAQHRQARRLTNADMKRGIDEFISSLADAFEAGRWPP